MTGEHEHGDRRERMFLLAVAACCIGPMLVIVGLTAVVGLAVGTARALTLALLAALGCILLMVQHRRRTRSRDRA